MINDELVFLTQKQFFEAGMLEGALNNNSIPYKKTDDAVATGALAPLKDNYSFYVLEKDVEKCKEILCVLFGEESL